MTDQAFAQRARAYLPRGHGIAPTLYRDYFRTGQYDPAARGAVAAKVPLWQELVQTDLPHIATAHCETGPDGRQTAKLVLQAADGRAWETVHLPMGRDRHTLCLSTQVGCRMACGFCETGRMGLIRQLTVAEIVSQVLVARHQQRWPIRNLVFMGMGEALDNPDGLFGALAVLTEQRGLSFSHERITVCTVGHVDGIRRLRELGWKRLNLSLSLNIADDSRRAELMPITRRWSLNDLQAALIDFPQRPAYVLGINVCLMPGINDSRADSRQIADFCRPIGRCLVNLIPYNPGKAPISRAPSETEIDRFVDWLRADGVAVRRRVTKGRSVMAACGQLGDATMRS